MVDLQGQPDHHRNGEFFGCLDDARQGLLACVEQGALMEQVVAGVG
jgi:hypothetical protein